LSSVGAAEVREAERPVQAMAVLVDVLPARVARCDQAVGDHVHRRVEVELLPLGAVRAAVLDLVLARRVLVQAARGRALGHRRPREIGESGIALDLDDLLVLDVDALAAAHRAVRADRPGHPVGRARARLQSLRRLGAGRLAEAEAVARQELAKQCGRGAGHPH
jgi:hypothetical protein